MDVHETRIYSHGLDNIGGLVPSLYSRAAVNVVKLHHDPCHKRERERDHLESLNDERDLPIEILHLDACL